MSCATDAFADSPNVAVRPTSASPITSAEAVTAVRRGFRIALARASEPAHAEHAQRPPDGGRERSGHRREEHDDPDEHAERAEGDDLYLVDHAGDVLGTHEPVHQDRAAHAR